MTSTPKITPEDARAFLDRPWDLIAEAKAEAWARLHETDPRTTVRATQALWRMFRDAGMADDPEQRAQDLADHIRLRALLDRAGRRLKMLGRAR